MTDPPFCLRKSILTSRIVFSFSVVDSMKPDKRALELASSSFEIDSQSSGKNFFAIANKLELNRSNPMKVCTNVLQIYNRKIVQFYFSGNKNPRVFLQFLLGEYFGLFRTNKV